MKNKKELLVNVLIVLTFFYLIGCFISTEFNIAKWDITLRGFLAFFSSFIVGVVFIAYDNKL